MYGIEVTFNGMTSLLNSIKNLLICSNVSLGGTQTDRQAENSDLINITFLFKESRLKDMTD
jgi:hypothetical protein